MKLHSIEVMKKYGVPRSILLHHLQHSLFIPVEFKHLMEEYILLYHTPEYFFKNQHKGSILRFNKEYIIIYNVPRGVCLHAPKLKISFREALPEYNLPAYAMVTI